MCLIVYKPEGRTFDRDIIETGMFGNSDGWGLMYVKNGKIVVKKSTVMDSLFTTLDKIDESAQAMSLHLRYATHGPVVTENCHPFVSPSKEFAMMHNGVISKMNIKGSESDTRAYCRDVAWDVLDKMGYESGVDFLEASDDSGSRFAYVNRAGRFMLAGKWIDRDGLKYSNAGGFWSTKKLDLRGLTSHYEPQDLIEMSDMTHTEIVKLCRDQPDYVAMLISDYLGCYVAEDYLDDPIDVDAF